MSDPGRIRLVALTAETIRALAARAGEGLIAQPDLAGSSWPAVDRRVLRYRIEALETDPAAAPFLLHAIVDQHGELIGRIGCHAAPDPAGEVEIGYLVVASARGRGVASAAVDAFLSWLAGCGVHSVVASVRPDNEPSLAILRRRGFLEFGSRIDDEDGRELLLRRSLVAVPAGFDGPGL